MNMLVDNKLIHRGFSMEITETAEAVKKEFNYIYAIDVASGSSNLG